MTTTVDVIRAAIPGASEAECDHVLWERPPFPFAAGAGDENNAETLRKVWAAMLAASPQDNVSVEDMGHAIEARLLKPNHPDYERP